MSREGNIFRDRLYDLEVNYPDDMWDKIYQQLPAKKDRRRGWILLLFGILFIGSVAGFYLSSLSTENNIPLYQEGDTSIANSSSKNIISTGSANSENQLETAFANEPESEQKTSAPNDLKEIPVNNYRSQQSSLDQETYNIEDDDIEGFSLKSTLITESPPTQNILPQNNETESGLEEEDTRSAVVGFELLETPHLRILQEGYEFSPPECPSFGMTRESGLYFDLLYSHDMPMRSFELKTQELNDYIDARNNTESTLYSFSASLRISYISSSGLGVKTGLNYSQINEKFVYLDPDASLIRTIITIDTLIVGGVPTVVSDTSTIRIPGSLDITTFNRYRFFDIPILATYEAPLNDKFYYAVNAGALINLAFSQKGRFLDPSEMPVWFTRGRPDRFDAFTSSAGLSLFGSLGLHYHLNDHLDIILEPNFRFYLGSLTTETYPLEQKWFTFGLSHGIRYKF